MMSTVSYRVFPSCGTTLNEIYGLSEPVVPTCSCPEDSIEAIFYQVLSLVAEHSKEFLVLQKKLIQGEKDWKEDLYRQIDETNSSLQQAHSLRQSTSMFQKQIGPLTLLANGLFGIVKGDTPLFGAASTALGGLLFLDNMLDDAGKKQVCQWLSMANGESPETWIGRIHLLTTTSMLMNIGLDSHKAITLATSVANVSLTIVNSSVDLHRDKIEACLLDMEQQIEHSEHMLGAHIESLKKAHEMTRRLFEAMVEMQKSMRSLHGVE